MTAWGLAALLALQPWPSPAAQSPQAPPVQEQPRMSVGGDLATLVDYLPRRGEALEWRSRLRLDLTWRPQPWLRLHADVVAELLVADRGGRVNDAIARPRDAWLEVSAPRLELRAGYGRLVWGRLDEIQPSDVLNPIDAARFLLEGRSEARLPVGFLRGRFFLPRETTIEGVVVSSPRRGRFDELDEATSPFNLLRDAVVPPFGTPGSPPTVDRVEPPVSWATFEPGVRISASTGRVDYSVSAFRGFESFGIVALEPALSPPAGAAVVGRLVERYPRFTMLAADFETASRGWSIRGEAAVFVERTFRGQLGPVEGRGVDAGLGLDRAAGDWHLFGSLVLHRQWSHADSTLDKQELSATASVERRFARERYRVRVFAVLNSAGSQFLRGLFTWSVRDNVTVDWSGALFSGSGDDAIGRFKGRDFVFARMTFHF